MEISSSCGWQSLARMPLTLAVHLSQITAPHLSRSSAPGLSSHSLRGSSVEDQSSTATRHAPILQISRTHIKLVSGFQINEDHWYHRINCWRWRRDLTFSMINSREESHARILRDTCQLVYGSGYLLDFSLLIPFQSPLSCWPSDLHFRSSPLIRLCMTSTLHQTSTFVWFNLLSWSFC